VLFAALETSGAVDFDVREALAALIRDAAHAGIGLYYETRPENMVAAELVRRIQESVAEFRRAERNGSKSPRPAIRKCWWYSVFLQRLEIDRNNGRKRGRAFKSTFCAGSFLGRQGSLCGGNSLADRYVAQAFKLCCVWF